MSNERIKVELQAKTWLIELNGAIDEGLKFPTDTAQITEVKINLGGVTMINSLGVKQWVRFLQTLKADTSVSISNCPTIIVNQMNLIPSFVSSRKTKVTSFFAPYFCPSCNKQHELLISNSRAIGEPPTVICEAPTHPCPVCGKALEFDEDDSYFSFTERQA